MIKLKAYQKQAISTIQQLAVKSGTPLEQYRVGDAIWLEAKNLKTSHQALKLAPKWYGPFKVDIQISLVAYKLQLPTLWNIHPIFYAALLSPYHETPTHRLNFSQPPPDLISIEEEYEVEQI
jgi:hypothetical protein